jgi:hypothetical protein
VNFIPPLGGGCSCIACAKDNYLNSATLDTRCLLLVSEGIYCYVATPDEPQ